MKIRIAGICLLTLLSGCTTQHLVYVQESTLGLSFAVSAEGMEKISLGYDRDVYAIVPKKNKTGDAMSLFSINNVEITGMDDMHISEFVAAGQPATELANDPDTIAKLRKKIYSK